MPRGLSDSFGDGMAKVLQELGALKLAPDADQELISQVEQLIIGYFNERQAESAQIPPVAPSAMGGDLAGAPMPVAEAGPSREIAGPPGDQAAMNTELQRILAGS